MHAGWSGFSLPWPPDSKLPSQAHDGSIPEDLPADPPDCRRPRAAAAACRLRLPRGPLPSSTPALLCASPPGAQVRVFDTTLRDGEQSPGCTLTSTEKLAIAKQLSKLGARFSSPEAYTLHSPPLGLRCWVATAASPRLPALPSGCMPSSQFCPQFRDALRTHAAVCWGPPAGVDVIEAGFPVASPDDFEAVRSIAQEVRG